MKFTQLAGSLVAATVIGTAAQADKLDDIISSGTLRCAVVLDFPPMGSRDDSNTPVGFDVDYCNDLAAALGVEAEEVRRAGRRPRLGNFLRFVIKVRKGPS